MMVGILSSLIKGLATVGKVVLKRALVPAVKTAFVGARHITTKLIGGTTAFASKAIKAGGIALASRASRPALKAAILGSTKVLSNTKVLTPLVTEMYVDLGKAAINKVSSNEKVKRAVDIFDKITGIPLI